MWGIKMNKKGLVGKGIVGIVLWVLFFILATTGVILLIRYLTS